MILDIFWGIKGGEAVARLVRGGWWSGLVDAYVDTGI
jgi:hypothetical protein